MIKLVRSPFTKLVALLLTASILSLGCASATQKAPTLPLYKPDPLPPPVEDRKDTVLPPKTGKPAALVKCTVKKGETADKDCVVPYTGILVDSYLLAKYKLQKAERDRMRNQIVIDRDAYTKTHAVTNEAFQAMAERAKRSWWENNKGTVGFWGGLVVGMGLAILTVFGISKAESAGSK
jgi:hypothetical protein